MTHYQVTIQDILENHVDGIDDLEDLDSSIRVFVGCWLKSIKIQRDNRILEVVDGSSQAHLEISYQKDWLPNDDEILELTVGSSLRIVLQILEPSRTFVLAPLEITIYQKAKPDYPLQGAGNSFEDLRSISHIRHREEKMRAVSVIYSTILKSSHQFFDTKGFHLTHLPTITKTACEGGCRPLQVTSLLGREGPTDIDYSQDYFHEPVYLSVSNQFLLEAKAQGLGKVYTMTSATRGEPYRTTRHLSQFLMLEAEHYFTNLNDNIKYAEEYLDFVIGRVLSKLRDELNLINPELEKHPWRIRSGFQRLKHREAIEVLRDAHQKKPFLKEPIYQGDLSDQHEKWLVAHYQRPVIVTHYPKAVKAFYMPVVEVVGGIEYVDCFDLLTSAGETIGGSQRIWKEDEILARMTEVSLDPKLFDYYLSLRRHGCAPHGGFGIGIERLCSFLTGLENIQDCTEIPLTSGRCPY